LLHTRRNTKIHEDFPLALLKVVAIANTIARNYIKSWVMSFDWW